MSSKSEEKGFVEIEHEEKDLFDLNCVIIPFSYYFRNDERFIYDGSEKIPFSKRDPLFKTILLQEFSDSIKLLKNNRKNY